MNLSARFIGRLDQIDRAALAAIAKSTAKLNTGFCWKEWMLLWAKSPPWN